VYHSRPADLLIRRIPVSLENPFELSQKPLRSITSTIQAEIEHHDSSGATVLPEIRLVILSPALACLHIDWGFVLLNVTPSDQLSPHRLGADNLFSTVIQLLQHRRDFANRCVGQTLTLEVGDREVVR